MLQAGASPEAGFPGSSGKPWHDAVSQRRTRRGCQILSRRLAAEPGFTGRPAFLGYDTRQTRTLRPRREPAARGTQARPYKCGRTSGSLLSLLGGEKLENVGHAMFGGDA